MGNSVRRDLIFMCADSGAVVTVTYSQAKRPALESAIVFLASGETLWVDPASSPAGRGTGLERRGSEDTAGHDLRMSAQATRLTGLNEIVIGEVAEGRHLPVGFDLSLEPASVETAIEDGVSQGPTRLLIVQGSGSLAVGSVIFRVRGSGWSSSGQPGDGGDTAGSRARAVFQDGSALFATYGPAAGSASGNAAAVVVNTHIRPVAAREFVIQGRDRGPARKIRWASEGRSPQRVSGEIRNIDQYANSVQPASGGTGWLSRSTTPFVFVRSGVTGLGLVERVTEAASAHAAPAGGDSLPDPY